MPQGRKYMSLYVGQTLDGQPTPVCHLTRHTAHTLQHSTHPTSQHTPYTHPYISHHTSAPPQAPPPLPDNPRVTLEAAGGQVAAVLRFEGFITPETAADARDQLMRCLQRGMLLRPRLAMQSQRLHILHQHHAQMGCSWRGLRRAECSGSVNMVPCTLWVGSTTCCWRSTCSW